MSSIEALIAYSLLQMLTRCICVYVLIDWGMKLSVEINQFTPKNQWWSVENCLYRCWNGETIETKQWSLLPHTKAVAISFLFIWLDSLWTIEPSYHRYCVYLCEKKKRHIFWILWCTFGCVDSIGNKHAHWTVVWHGLVWCGVVCMSTCRSRMITMISSGHWIIHGTFFLWKLYYRFQST